MWVPCRGPNGWLDFSWQSEGLNGNCVYRHSWSEWKLHIDIVGLSGNCICRHSRSELRNWSLSGIQTHERGKKNADLQKKYLKLWFVCLFVFGYILHHCVIPVHAMYPWWCLVAPYNWCMVNYTVCWMLLALYGSHWINGTELLSEFNSFWGSQSTSRGQRTILVALAISWVFV